MPQSPHIPVLIVGAGPTGLTAAMELSRLGVAVRIVDRAERPSSESRALAVQARTLELLRVRGVGETMLASGNRATSAALYADGKKLAPIELNRMPSDFNFILMLAQSETERLLTDEAGQHGVKVERGVEVTSVRRVSEEQPVEVKLRSGDGSEQVLTASYVIAADGPHSGIRKALGLAFPGRTLPQNYLLADLHIDGAIPQDQVSIFLSGAGFVAVFPMGDGRFRLMATDPHGVLGDADEPSVQHIQQLFDRVVHVPARLHAMNWGSRFRINSRNMRTLRSGRVFFGGDAAHVHSPAGGQGMNVGIQDMVNLSWKLAMVLDGRAKPELLDTYSSERLPVIRQVVRVTEIGTRIFNSTNPVVHAARIRMAPKALSRNRVQNAAASMFGQLAAGYRDGALAENGGGIGVLRAGDRVPDAAGLYDALDLNALTLFSGDDRSSDGDGASRDGAGAACNGTYRVVDVARRWAGVVTVRNRPALDHGSWMLVRPDGYLAAAGDNAASLDRWLSRWFVTESVAPN